MLYYNYNSTGIPGKVFPMKLNQSSREVRKINLLYNNKLGFPPVDRCRDELSQMRLTEASGTEKSLLYMDKRLSDAPVKNESVSYEASEQGLKQGIILKSRYCILDRLAKGGGGCLYLARDLELGTLWAIKQIPIADKKEAKLLRLLEHPSLPRMVDYLEREEFCYLVMEYVRGKSLGQWLREGRRFGVREAAALGMEAAQVLDYLHSRKPPVYYGDLKPDNLMLSEAGRLYLVDFGSAVFDYGINQRVCQGTRGFAAPEQYEGKVSRASDVYALGRTLWALLGKKKWQLVLRHPGFGRIVGKCCRKEEVRRYKDMKEVAKALALVQGNSKPRRMELVLTAVLSFVVLVTVGGFWLRAERAPEFLEALTQVTQRYYENGFLQGDAELQRQIFRETELELQKLLGVYQGKEEQRRTLLLLAANGEYQEEYEHAALYYEQLMLYDPGCREAYGEYGMFLWRLGQCEESKRLWADYQKKERAGLLEQGECRNLALWEERINEWEKEKKG